MPWATPGSPVVVGCRRVGAPRAASAAAKISEALDVAIEVALDESA
jgi:hypothetical protein